MGSCRTIIVKINTNDRNTFPAAKEGGPVPGAPSCVFCSFLPCRPSGSLKLSFSVYPFPMNAKTKWNTKKEWNIKTKRNARIKHMTDKTSCAGRIRLRAAVARMAVAAYRIMVRTAMAILFLLTAVLLYQIYMENHFQIYDSALRFHVRAASDGAEEQELKLKVRDEVLAVLRPAADRAESAGELKTEVEKMLPDIAQTAAKMPSGCLWCGRDFRRAGTGKCSSRRAFMRRCGWISERPKDITGGVQFTRNYVIMQRNLPLCQKRAEKTWKEIFPGKKVRYFLEKRDAFG